MAKYFHTLDSQPAMYNGEQVVFVQRYYRVPLSRFLVGSLRQIRREWAASQRWRTAQGLSATDPVRHSYQRLTEVAHG